MCINVYKFAKRSGNFCDRTKLKEIIIRREKLEQNPSNDDASRIRIKRFSQNLLVARKLK